MWRHRVEPICFRRVAYIRWMHTASSQTKFYFHFQQPWSTVTSLFFLFTIYHSFLFVCCLTNFCFSLFYFCLFFLISVSCALNQILGKGCRSRKIIIATHWKTVILLLLGKIKTDTGPLSDLVFRFQSYRSSSGEL